MWQSKLACAFEVGILPVCKMEHLQIRKWDLVSFTFSILRSNSPSWKQRLFTPLGCLNWLCLSSLFLSQHCPMAGDFPPAFPWHGRLCQHSCWLWFFLEPLSIRRPLAAFFFWCHISLPVSLVDVGQNLTPPILGLCLPCGHMPSFPLTNSGSFIFYQNAVLNSVAIGKPNQHPNFGILKSDSDTSSLCHPNNVNIGKTYMWKRGYVSNSPGVSQEVHFSKGVSSTLFL